MREDNIKLELIPQAVEQVIARHQFEWDMFNLALDSWYKPIELGNGIQTVPLCELLGYPLSEYLAQV